MIPFDVAWKWTSGWMKWVFEAFATSNFRCVLVSYHLKMKASVKFSTESQSTGRDSTNYIFSPIFFLNPMHFCCVESFPQLCFRF